MQLSNHANQTEIFVHFMFTIRFQEGEHDNQTIKYYWFFINYLQYMDTKLKFI